MSGKNILAFEADPIYGRMLTEQLGQRGYQVDLVSDGVEGLEKAASSSPDLIYLCVELPRINGFSICKRLRKSSDTEKTPLIITASDVTEQTFEKHKKLKVRADEYLLKPFDVEQIIELVEKLIPGSDDSLFGVTDDDLDEEEVEIDEVEDLEDIEDLEVFDDVDDIEEIEDLEDVDDLIIEEEDDVDAEVDAFTDEAFAALELDDDSELDIVEESVSLSVVSDETDDLDEPDASGDSEESNVSPQVDGDSSSDGEVERLSRENAHLSEKISALENEVVDAKTQNGAGVSSRELLDLRELLNKKDRELLDYKDDLMGKDKAILNLEEQNSELEGEKGEWTQRETDLNRKIKELDEKMEAHQADKEVLNKKAEDLTGRVEQFQAQNESLEDQLRNLGEEKEELSAKADSDLEQAQRRHETLLAEQQAEWNTEKDNALDELRQELDAAKEAEKQAVLDEQRASMEAAFEEQKKEALIEQRLRHDKEVEEIKAQLGEEKASALSSQASDYDDRIEELQADNDNAISELTEKIGALEEGSRKIMSEKAALEEQLSDKETELSAAREELELSHKETGDVKQTLSESQDENTKLFSKLGRANADLEDRDAKIERLEGEIEEAHDTLSGRDEIVMRTRQALEIAAKLLGEIEVEEELDEDDLEEEEN